jgi:hypothetical protein
MLIRLYSAASPWVNKLLRPLGFTMSGHFHCEGDLPTEDDPLRFTGISITRSTF